MVIIDHLCSLLGSAVFVSASEESTKANALGQEDDAMPLRYTSTPSSDSLINIDRFSLISEIVMLVVCAWEWRAVRRLVRAAVAAPSPPHVPPRLLSAAGLAPHRASGHKPGPFTRRRRRVKQ